MDWDSTDENDGGPTYMSLSASSYHSGGVNCLMADGSVRFIKNSIGAAVTWPPLAALPAAKSSPPINSDPADRFDQCHPRSSESDDPGLLSGTGARVFSEVFMRTVVALSISLAALLRQPGAGCGAPPDVNSQLIPVKGKVTYKGKALTSGSVTFEPEAGRAAHAEIKPDGTYEISTFKAGDGAVLGTHKVSIVGSTGKGNANASHEIQVPQLLEAGSRRQRRQDRLQLRPQMTPA